MKVNISPSHPPSVSPPSRVKISVFISHPPLLSSPPQPWQVNTEYNQAVTDKSQVSKYLLHGFRHGKILLLCTKIYCIHNLKFNFLLSLIIIKHLTSPQIGKDKSNSVRTKKFAKNANYPVTAFVTNTCGRASAGVAPGVWWPLLTNQRSLFLA